MSKDTGGPAFPVPVQNYKDQEGMTLRDYFAAKAMPFCAAGDAEVKARQAYAMADAMLKERAK